MTHSFIRRRGGVQVPSFDLAQALRDALAVDGVAELWDHPPGGAPCLVFTLQRSGVATMVLAPDDRHLATYADPAAGVAHGFGLVDHAAEHQRATHPSFTRARRRSTEKAPMP